MLNKIDHFAVGTDLLENGMAAMHDALGVKLSLGGKHDLMSKYNCVMQAGNESFFELIAIDPAAPEPDRPRWFSLDDPATMRRLAERTSTGIQIKTILNHVPKFKSFVYGEARLLSNTDQPTLEVDVHESRNSWALCSVCEQPATS